MFKIFEAPLSPKNLTLAVSTYGNVTINALYD
jgi:hypothetical protein